MILIEHDVCVREFAPAVYRCLPKVGPNGEWDVPEEEIAKRCSYICLLRTSLFSILL